MNAQPFFNVQKLLLSFALALFATGCNSPNEPVTEAAAVASGSLSDGEILQFLHTLNTGEMEQARLALQNSDNPTIHDAAQHILEDHSDANEQIESLAGSGIELEKSPLSRGLKVQADRIANNLEELSGSEFDCTFLEKQIEQHELALETLRDDLRPDADQQRIRELLNNVETSLEGHLQASRSTRGSMAQCPDDYESDVTG